MDASIFSPEAAAILDGCKDRCGRSIPAISALNTVGVFDSCLPLKSSDPREWGPTDYVGAICPALSLICSNKDYVPVLWDLVFAGVKSGLTFPVGSVEHTVAATVQEFLESHINGIERSQ